MRAGVPLNLRSSSPNGNNPTRNPPFRAHNRRGCIPRPSHLCQADIHSQERNGEALAASKSACHSVARVDRDSYPLNSSTTNLLTSLPHLMLTKIVFAVQRVNVAPNVLTISPGVFMRAGRRQTVISSGQVDEERQIRKRRQKVISRIFDFRRNSHDDVFLEFASGEVISK